MVKPNIMQLCIDELLTGDEEATLVCLCKLFQTIGSKLEAMLSEKESSRCYVSECFEKLESLSITHSSIRVRYLLRDLIDMRNNGWQARREEEKEIKLNDN